jgi:glutamine synthetase
VNLAELENKVAAGDIDTVVAVFPDVFGRLVGKRFTAPTFLQQIAAHGTHACNYLLTLNIEMDPQDGFALANWEKGFGDFEMRPDFESLRLLPWQTGAVMVLCDLHHHDGTPVAEAPRNVLRRQVARLNARGFACKLASELEFFLFNHTFHEACERGFTELTPSSDYRIDYHTMQTARDEPIMRAIRTQMPLARVPIESTKGEWGRGQHEANFIYDEPIPIADLHAVFKQGVKEIAEQHGKSITFMAKPWAEEVGSSCHIHLSLWQDGRNAFAEGDEGSALFRHFLAGLIRYSRELSYFTAPTINAYKRYQSASWAPTKMAWAHDNRTVGFRVVGHGNAFRIENRMPGADANPYLAFAAMIAAGLAGTEEKLECPPLYVGNAYVDSKLPSLPRSLAEAGELLHASKCARDAFGDAVVDFYVHTARLEADAFQNAVTDWERARYFERI